jgi:hypothetical protein
MVDHGPGLVRSATSLLIRANPYSAPQTDPSPTFSQMARGPLGKSIQVARPLSSLMHDDEFFRLLVKSLHAPCVYGAGNKFGPALVKPTRQAVGSRFDVEIPLVKNPFLDVTSPFPYVKSHILDVKWQCLNVKR